MSANIPENEKFKKSRVITANSSTLSISGNLPGERAAKGDVIRELVTIKDSDPNHTPRQIELREKLAEGGEGSVFTTSLGGGFVAKIYRRDRLTTDRQEKITRMISKKIDCPGVCFPEALVLNDRREFVGYLMREAKGYELGKSVFQPQLFLKRFQDWKKRDTIQLCLTILQKIKYLNDRNVILGDINPANILVVSPKEVYFVDCDSYQIEGFPCPVGTVNFTPPEAQRWKDYKTNLRTQEMENYAIATLLFMIMLPGKPPYSAVGGESQSENIIKGEFPYPLTEDTDKTPPGRWGFIWSHLSYKTKEAFFQTFKRGEERYQPNKRRNADEWIEVFETYQHGLNSMIKNDPMANDIFPTRNKGDYIVEQRTCNSCGKSFGITKSLKDWEQRKSQQQGNAVRVEICDACKAKRSRSINSARSGGYQNPQSNQNLRSYQTPTIPRRTAQTTNSYTNRTSGYGSAGSGTQTRQTTSVPAGRSKIIGSGRTKQTPRANQSAAKPKQNQPATNPVQKTQKSGAGKIIAIAIAVLLFIVIPIAVTSYTGNANTSAETYSSYRLSLDKQSDEQLAKSSIVKYGNYPTNVNGEAKPIYWHKLSQTEDTVTLYSSFVLDSVPYNNAEGECAWGSSSIRLWLNNDFLAAAFSEEERSQLRPVDEEDPEATVALITPAEAAAHNNELMLYPTPYATKQGASPRWNIRNGEDKVEKSGCADWWLKSKDVNTWAPVIEGLWHSNDKDEFYEEWQATEKCGVVPVIKVAVSNP